MPILKVSEKTGHDYTSGILKLTPDQAQQETTFVDGQRVLVVSGNNDLNSTYEFVEQLDNAPLQSVEGIIKINSGGFLVQVDAQVPSLPRLSIEYIASTGAGNDQMYIDSATQQLLYVANKTIIELGSTENGEVAPNNALITIQVASEDLLPPVEHRAIGECALVGNEHVYVVTNDRTWVKIKNSLYVRISDLENKVIAARSDIDTHSSHIGDYTHTQDITTRLDNIIQELTTIKKSITVLDDKSDSTDVTLAESITAINNNITNINSRIDGIINNDIDHLNTAISNINNLLIDVESGDLLLLKTHIENLQQALDKLETEEISVIKIKIEQLSNQKGYDDSALQARISALENKVDHDTIYNDTELRNRISVLENKTDNDTVYNDQPVIERLNALEQKSIMPNYATDVEFLESNTIFGFINNDGFGNPVLAYAQSGRAFDYISKKKLGMDVGVHAIPKLTLVYKEEGKQDELKSFVPIALSEIQGTTLIPSTSGNIFWGEWLNASNNQGGYIICVIDGVLMLSQWTGVPASSVEELFTKIAAGGDISQDVSPVHKLTATPEHMRAITYANGDTYNIMKQGTYRYTVQRTDFYLHLSYTGMIEQSDVVGTGYIEPELPGENPYVNDIQVASNEYNPVDNKIYMIMQFYTNTDTITHSIAFKPIARSYLSKFYNYTNMLKIEQVNTNQWVSIPDNLITWAHTNYKNYNVNNAYIFAPTFHYSEDTNVSNILFKGISDSNIFRTLINFRNVNNNTLKVDDSERIDFFGNYADQDIYQNSSTINRIPRPFKYNMNNQSFTFKEDDKPTIVSHIRIK
ncbi:MAG: hypothetical protein AAF195_00930, partial [Pseudomonadota bacterium]